ncbi:MAG: 1-acyl-sn-glycerol-3-phosphate acyltransferase [Deltaproteobacteria bacterium]|nr:1-acyl-sn-glycerol-3-phosphate acyltransferase [Deltaproteobacteria bacterium]
MPRVFANAVSRIPVQIRRQPEVFFSIIYKIISYFLIFFISFISWVYFFVLNRTEIKGGKNITHKKNTLYLSNHQTMIDSFLIGTAISFPALFLKPSLLPWHPAAEENFFRNSFQSFFSNMWKCIPVRRGQHDFHALELMENALKNSTMLIYPEGSRSRTGEISKGRPGTGKLIHDTKCTCIPVRIRGMENILPIGRKFPGFFKKITVSFGSEVDYSEYTKLPSSRKTSEKIIEKVMEDIRKL